MTILEFFLLTELGYKPSLIKALAKDITAICGDILTKERLELFILKVIDSTDLVLKTSFKLSRDAGFSAMRNLPDRDTAIKALLIKAAKQVKEK